MNGSVSYEGAILSGNISINTGATLEELTADHNGVYLPSEGKDGFSKVTVDVPDPVLDDITITENGTYTPPSGVDGYDDITVNVPIQEPVLESISITENGTYTPPSGVDGYDDIDVNVPIPVPVLESISITENGTYTPPSGIDGYDDITVNVPSGFIKYLDNKLVGSTNPQYMTVSMDVNLVSGKWYILALNDPTYPNAVLYTMFQYSGTAVNVQIVGGGETYQATISGSQFSLTYWSGDWRNIYGTITEASSDQFYLPS